jgi:uncharacterized membrane protein
MELGPLDVLVLEFPGEEPDQRSVAALREVEASGVIRMIDVLVLTRGQDGTVEYAEASDVSSVEDLAADLLAREMLGLLSHEDVVEAGDMLDPGTSALVLLIENVWARAASRTIRAAGGRLTATARIPHDQVEEALTRMAGGPAETHG